MVSAILTTSTKLNVTSLLTPSETDGNEIILPDSVKSRAKRGVIQLASMISCVAGCDALSYKGYGCYCGYGGSGIPVDSIDR